MSEKKKKKKAKEESSEKPINLARALKKIVEKGKPDILKKKKI